MPIVLPHDGQWLRDQVREKLATDTDPALGLVSALGAGVDSIFPNFMTDGPSADRAKCPTPFIVVRGGGARAKDRMLREVRLMLDIHDDEGAGDKHWPGILIRLKDLLVVRQWRPTDDALYRYTGGLQYESESEVLYSDTYNTNAVRLVLVAVASDRTSGRGYGG
jgi:hypothetical protein